MKTYLDCIPCVVRQALDASRRVTDDQSIQERVVRATLQMAMDMPFNRPPPWMGQRIHRMIREETGNPDPYKRAKQESNTQVLDLYPDLKRRVQASPDPFGAALRLAIAGNIIDIACKTTLTRDEVNRAINTAIETHVEEACETALRKAIDGAARILYLADNAGEIVLDRLLMEEMPTERITLAVRGEPVINDATLEDAESAGLSGLITVMNNGSDAPGTILEDCSPAFRARFECSDLIIAKGQGNYETLSDMCGNLFFLLMVKCPVIARDIGCEVGEMMVLQQDQKKTGDGERKLSSQSEGMYS